MRKISPLIGVMLLLAFATGLALAQSGGNFEITKNTIDSGGGKLVGGNYSLTGTIGQADASVQTSSGGEFMLAGGFWAIAGGVVDRIFDDGFESP